VKEVREMRPFSPGGLAIAAVLALAAPVASADETRVGAWSVGLTKERAGTFAATADERGAQLGQFCYPEHATCVWILAVDLGCAAGTNYPVVVNTDSGAAVLEMVCLGFEGKAAFAFTDFDAMDGIVRRESHVAMALPTANGLFRFTRFSLDGATRAVALMREAAGAMGGKPKAAAAVSF
jgi:hypothetical protein